MEKNRVVEVYAESTPNPAAMKFVVNRMLLSGGVVEYFRKEEARLCPLAMQLFDFTGVKSVFITSNFVTVTKDDGMDWYDLMPILREAVRGFFVAGERLFLADPLAEPNGTDGATEPPAAAEGTEQDVQDRIVRALEEYVRPAVEQDGGAIHFKSYRDGVVTLLLKGSCSGCPSSTVTLKAGIENLLRKLIPEVNAVEAEEG